jgi:carbon monoxide dehydrogenase subunit G
VISVELIPEGAGTRVRIETAQEPAGVLRGIAMRLMTQRAIERHIATSLKQLEGMLQGRMV